MTIKSKWLKYLGVLSVGLVTFPSPSAYAQETDVSNYVIIDDYLSINPEALESEVDMTTLPYYSYGEIDRDKIIAQVEEYFDSESVLTEMESATDEMVAPYFELEGTEYKYTLNASSNAATQADLLFFDLFKSLGGAYTPTLTNFFIDSYADFEEVLPLTNPELDFMSPEEAESLIAEMVNQLLNVEKVGIVLKSMTKSEMQSYIDYQNINQLKPDTPAFTGEVDDVYIGKIIPQIGDYPIHVADATGMTDYTLALQGTFALTSEGVEFLEFLPYTPIGEEIGYYEETLTYEEVIEIVTDNFTTDPDDFKSQLQDPEKIYIRSISVVYMPVDQTDLGTAGYFPMWQVDYSLENLIDTAFHAFVNPLNGEIY